MKSICSADHIIGYNESVTAKGEKNDCVVRAVASTFRLKYDTAHKFVQDEFSRQPRKGTFATAFKLQKRTNILGTKYNVLPKSSISYEGSSRHQMNGGKIVPMTLSIFLKQFPKGRFLIIVKQHAFSVIDGVVIGNSDDGNRLRAKILFALKVEE